MPHFDVVLSPHIQQQHEGWLTPGSSIEPIATDDVLFRPVFAPGWLAQTLAALLHQPPTPYIDMLHSLQIAPHTSTRTLQLHLYAIIAHGFTQWWRTQHSTKGSILTVTAQGIHLKPTITTTLQSHVLNDMCVEVQQYCKNMTMGLTRAVFQPPFTRVTLLPTAPHAFAGLDITWRFNFPAQLYNRHATAPNLTLLYDHPTPTTMPIGFDLQATFVEHFEGVLGATLHPTTHIAIRTVLDFIDVFYPQCFKQLADGTSAFNINAHQQRVVILMFMRIFNDFGLLSQSTRDVLYQHPTTKRLVYPTAVYDTDTQRPLYPFIYTRGDTYDAVIARFLALCPFTTVLWPVFRIRAYDTVISHTMLLEYMTSQLHLPVFPFPIMPIPTALGFAFADGFLCLSSKTHTGTVLRNPQVTWVPWIQADPKIHVCFAEQACNVSIASTIQLLSDLNMAPTTGTQPHWLAFLVASITDYQDPLLRAIYAIILIVLKQVRCFATATPVPIHAIDDTEAWHAITKAEWDCVEYMLMLLGWALGVHCDFPVIVWLQGAPNTGKSTLVTFVESLVRASSKLNPADNSKHMLNILHTTATNTITADSLVIVDDVQKPLPSLAIQLLCSITDPGPRGTLTCDPKGSTPLSLSKAHCHNVCVIGAANIPTSTAFGADEYSSGIYRRAFVFSLPTTTTDAHTDPKDLLNEDTVSAMLVALATLTGAYHSKRAGSRAPSPPTLIQALNASYEQQYSTNDINELVQHFITKYTRPAHDNVNKALPCATLYREFTRYCTKINPVYSKQLSRVKFITQVKKWIQDNMPPYVRYYARSYICTECNNIYNWQDPTGQSHEHWVSSTTQARENAALHECQCLIPDTQCTIIAKNDILANVTLCLPEHANAY